MPDTPETPDPKKPEAADPVTPPVRRVPPTPAPGPASPPVPPPPAPSPERWKPSEGVSTPVTPGVPPPYSPPRPKRTSEEIRRDIEAQREQLSHNVDHLRDKVTELTDWRGQLMKHRKKIVVGAVATGFVVGGLMALRRR